MRRRALAVLLGLAGLVLAAPGLPAVAIPPGGPGADTPGTSSSVSPATLSPCDTISFTVSGYPAGEIVYIKIDDGIGYGDTSVQGSGVWHSQAIPSSGTVNGSFELPCDITPGAHWLRFLASQYVDPNDPGKGVIGFTRRGGSDFTVVAAGGPSGTGYSSTGQSGSGGTGSIGSGRSGSNSGSGSGGANSTGGGSTSGLGGAAPEAGATVGSGAEQLAGQGAILAIDPNLAGAAEASPSPSAVASASAEASDRSSAPAGDTADASASGSGVPAFGLVGGMLLVAAGAAAVILARRWQRR
jgi:hypothetical protein